MCQSQQSLLRKLKEVCSDIIERLKTNNENLNQGVLNF